jgi:hypothetical protein
MHQCVALPTPRYPSHLRNNDCAISVTGALQVVGHPKFLLSALTLGISFAADKAGNNQSRLFRVSIALLYLASEFSIFFLPCPYSSDQPPSQSSDCHNHSLLILAV